MSAAPASRFRQSRFKHIYGKAAKRECCYDNIRVAMTGGDSATFCAVNPRYIAVVTDAVGGGAFVVLPIEQHGRVERDPPLVAGHTAAVLDVQWCPHDDRCIASASEDCTAKVWLIRPDLFALTGRRMTECHRHLAGHSRRVNLVLWHPTARMVLLTGGADNKVLIWNADEQAILCDVNFPDAVVSCSFNWTGCLFVCSCRDRVCRIVNPRTGETRAEARLHAGPKPEQVVFLRDGRVFSTGFSRASERQWGLWDGRSLEVIDRQDLDSSNGVLFPHYDPDVNLIYLIGKGDSAIRFFELTNEAPYLHYLSTYQSSEPQRGFGCMPKRGLDARACEIGRVYKLHQRGLCEPISFTVPRKCGLFQADLYPDTCAEAWAVLAEDWAAGVDASPVLVPVRPSVGYSGAVHTMTTTATVTVPRRPIVGPMAVVAKNADLQATISSEAAQQLNHQDVKTLQDSVSGLSGVVDGLRDSVRQLSAQNASLSDRLARVESTVGLAASQNHACDAGHDDEPLSEDFHMAED